MPETRTDTDPTFGEILDELLELAGGLVAALLPFVLLSAPAIIPLAVFTGVVVGALGLVLALVGAVVAGPILLVRRVLR